MAKIDPAAWVAPGAIIRGNVTLAEDVGIWYNAVLRADEVSITVGAGTNIQDNCVVHGDKGNNITIGRNCTIGHSAVVHGCTIGDTCLIGMNAVVLDNAVIGEGSIVGAGAVVGAGTIIPPRSLVVGIPAKVKRTVSDEAVAGTLENAEEYIALMRQARNDPENA